MLSSPSLWKGTSHPGQRLVGTCMWWVERFPRPEVLVPGWAWPLMVWFNMLALKSGEGKVGALEGEATKTSRGQP